MTIVGMLNLKDHTGALLPQHAKHPILLQKQSQIVNEQCDQRDIYQTKTTQPTNETIVNPTACGGVYSSSAGSVFDACATFRFGRAESGQISL